MPAAISNSCEEMVVSPLVKETVIIFDWDDTLLASSFLASKGYNRLDEALNRTNDVDAQLKELEQAVIALLTMALSYGHVNIITNAETGWVQLSAQTFIPAVLPILDRVCISSARSTYEPIFPQSPLQWKFCAFHDKVVNGFVDSANLERNVVSFGDSRVEREAVLSVTRNLPRTRCKSIKFAERPTLEQLRLQLELVSRCFPQIYQHDGDLDLQLTVLTDSPSPVVSPGPSRPGTPTPPLGPAAAPSAPSLAPQGTCVGGNNSTDGQQAAAAGLGPAMMEAEPLPAIPPAVANCMAGQRVRVSGFQAALAAPLAVACGANSSLVIDSNGAASVLPTANVAAATAMICASKVLGDNGANHEREVTVLAS